MLLVEAAQGDITEFEGDAIVVNLFKGVTSPGGATGAVDKVMGSALTQLIGTGDFTGRTGETAMLYTGGAIPAKRVLVVGLGKQDEFDLNVVRKAAGATVKAFKGTKVRHAATIVHGAGVGGLDAALAAQALAEAAVSASYRFERKGDDGSKSDDEEDEHGDDDKPSLAKLTVLEADAGTFDAVAAGVERGSIVGNCQAVARDLASISGVEATATAIADFVAKLAEETPGLACRVLDKAAIREERMGGLLAVNQGSDEEPRFLVLDWNPAGAQRTVCLVGKGVTFDTGGISIKPSGGMDKMRYDKSGAAATIGTLLAVAKLELPLRVIGLTPLTDNMPSGRAVKPGDVITMRSGLTVDVLNTDAEGRLILADALDYAKQFEPEYIVDMATLTGAATVALGTQCIAAMGDDELVAQLKRAGDESHERVWQLPFYKEYEEQIKGDVGDIKNTGGRPAGTITAGKFLARFAPEKGWVHLDIASTAWNQDKPFFNGDYYPAGSTGAGVRLLTTWLSSLDAA